MGYMTAKDSMKVPAYELKLGDVVETFSHGPFNHAVVIKIVEPQEYDKHKGFASTPGYITLYRPYGTCADFSMGGGGTYEPEYSSVIPYTGIETYDVPRKPSGGAALWHVLQRKTMKEGYDPTPTGAPDPAHVGSNAEYLLNN